MNNLKAINKIIEYIIYSEMEGEIDKNDSWYPTLESLQELKEKILEEETEWAGKINESLLYKPSQSVGNVERKPLTLIVL